MDATKTGPAAFGHDCTHRSRAACSHRFSTSDRIDPAVCGNVSGSLLGKQLVARKIQLAGQDQAPVQDKGRCKPHLTPATNRRADYGIVNYAPLPSWSGVDWRL